MNIEAIKDLIGQAMSASNKTNAEQYIQKLKMIRASAQMSEYAHSVLGDLIAYTKSASGQARNKQQCIEMAEQRLYVLERELSKSTDLQ